MNRPALAVNKEDCCGCSACLTVCPKEAIRFEEDIEGFNYPVIDDEKCVGCMLCMKACPLITEE